MHSLLLGLTTLGAIALRLLLLGDGCARFTGNRSKPLPWANRWQRGLLAFSLPPLLLLAMAIAVLTMGRHGSMLGWSVGWLGYGSALGLVLWTLFQLLLQTYLTTLSCRRVGTLPQVPLASEVARLLSTEVPFAARVGFWRSQLVLSSGLTEQLSPAQFQAVLRHEQAHLEYRDTFWFFWLGWLRRSLPWLPATEALWQELLLLRELRADRWAARDCDPIALAESLLALAQAGKGAEPGWALFADEVLEGGPVSRLEQRLDALLTPGFVPALGQAGQAQPDDEASEELQAPRWVMASLALAALPLLTNLLHQAL
jgi:Zn-dependent protease with chaperone function